MIHSPDDNLLVALHKWAKLNRQEENFITEAFAHLLRHLCRHEQAIAEKLLRELTDTTLEPQKLVVTTQVTVDEGRPDLELRTPDHLVYIEVKVESELHQGQLQGYQKALTSERSKSEKNGGTLATRLVLLSRYHIAPPDDAQPVTCRRWYEIAERLLSYRDRVQEASRALLDQFLGLLRERKLMMTQVSRELRSGVNSLRSLLGLVEAAAASVVSSSKIEKSPAWEWIGYYLESQEFFVGVYYDAPDTVVFETQKLSIPENAASKAGFGEMGTTSKSPTGNKWICKLDLASEDVDFFALSTPNQLDRIKEFLKKCLDTGRTLGGKG